MLKSNLFRFKKKYFLTSRLCARDYKWYFYTETFDIKENKFLISPTEWCYVVNNHYSDCPSWFQKLKNNVLIMTIIKSLNMVLIEYEIKLIQTTHFSWGKNQVQVEDYWTFNNEYGIIMKTDYWSLMGETTFYLINSHIENIMVRIDVMKSHLKVNKSLTTQIARIILFSKIITNVVKISLFQEVLDRVKNEGLSINLIDEPIESEVNEIIQETHLISMAKHKFLLKINFTKKYYHLQYSECENDYIQFDINYMSTYSFRHILYLLANHYTKKDYLNFNNELY